MGDDPASVDRSRSTPPLIPKLSDLTVIKAGTGVLTNADGSLDRASVTHLVLQIADLMKSGHRCLFVSSGAVGSGVSAFSLKEYPKDTVTKQACAAVGQARLMHLYTSLFANFNIIVAQVLLSARDVATPERRRCISDTLLRLIEEPNVLPIINENDTVSVDGLKFGDNDMLSYHVANIVQARRLVLLTSVDGLLDPNTGKLVPEVTCVDGVFGHVREGDKGNFSLGGMLSKLTAVKLAVESGIETHIAAGRKPERLPAILAGTMGVSTYFHPARQENKQTMPQASWG